MAFKDYNGNTITLTHTHVPADTQKNGEIALATTLEAGFMSKDDRTRLTNLQTKLTSLETTMSKAVYAGDEVLKDKVI